MTNRIRMRHLRCFIEVARRGSITRAAEELNTVQPSLSRTLRELEEEIGQPLFERTGQGLVLTTASETFMRHVGVGMAQIARGVHQVRGQGDAGAVTIGMLPNVTRTLMPRAVARFKASAPETDVRTINSTVPDLIERLRSGEIDFVIGRLPSLENMKGVSFEHLYSESLIFVTRPGHALAGQPAVTLTDLNRHAMLIPQAGTIIRNELDRFAMARGITEFANKIESVSFEFTRAYLAANDAIASS